ncbi:MAG: choice-of-anchor D domain-containing protein [Burkholderiales bacterium]
MSKKINGNIVLLLLLTPAAFANPLGNLNPSGLAFGVQAVGTNSLPQTVTLSNTGSTTLVLSDIKLSSEFSLGDPCFTEGEQCLVAPKLPCTTIEPGKGCTFNVWYSPKTIRGRTGLLRFYSNAVGSPHTVLLVGQTDLLCPQPTPLPYHGDFADTPVGQVSSQILTFPFTPDAHTWGDFFIQSIDCGASQPAAQSCTVKVAFLPSVAGQRLGKLNLFPHGTCSLNLISLFGNGTGANISNPALPSMPVNPSVNGLPTPTPTPTQIPVDSVPPVPSANTGGCAIGNSGGIDPVLILLTCIALFRLSRRKI